jgi:2-oxoglutarate ferredoxin oxidoreductase subunit alpha
MTVTPNSRMQRMSSRTGRGVMRAAWMPALRRGLAVALLCVATFASAQEAGTPVLPYSRNDDLARPWIKPGTPGLEHRIGGIEKAPGSGNIDYSAEAHAEMTRIRAAKVAGIAESIPDQEVSLGNASGKLAIVGWGSTYGPIHQAVRRARLGGLDVSHIHLRYIAPMPRNMAVLLKGFEHILVPEMNTGQLKTVIRDQFLVDARPLNKVSGQPFTIAEIGAAIDGLLGGAA